jgi:hypothetical protein
VHPEWGEIGAGLVPLAVQADIGANAPKPVSLYEPFSAWVFPSGQEVFVWSNLLFFMK